MYFILKCFSPPSGHLARIEYRDDDPFRFWNGGESLESIPDLPLRAKVVTDHDTVLAEFWDSSLPLLTTRLYNTLVAAGVKNLDVYPAVLTDSRTGEEHKEYLAFNIIGLIEATDLHATTFAKGSEHFISADIDKLVIDPAKAGGALMFRLAEAVNMIVVHDKIKVAVEAAGINTLTFFNPEDLIA